MNIPTNCSQIIKHAGMEINGLDYFEKLIEKFLVDLGFLKVENTGKYDHGIDIIFEDEDGNRIGIQAKNHSNPIRPKKLNRMIDGQDYYELDKIILVTTNTLKSKSYNLCLRNNIDVYEFHHLNRILRRYHSLPSDYEKTLREDLYILRDTIAEEKGCPNPNYMFTTTAIDNIIKCNPKTFLEYRNIDQIGVKRGNYYDKVKQILDQY